MSFLNLPEPQSGLSVIPEATEENMGSSAFLMLKMRNSKIETGEKTDSVPLVESVQIDQPKNTSDTRDGEINEFRAVMLVGKQPYASCCCSLF